MTDILNELSALAAAIHYPDCWDTAAYPDLLSALHEVTASAGCSMCKSPVELDDPYRLIVLGAPSRRQFQEVRDESALLREERGKLIQAVADHVTVRAEQYQQIQDLQAELATAAVTDDRAIADTVNDLRIVAIKFHAAEQLRARIADVIVPGLKRIQKLEELNDKRLGEIRTTLKLLAEARGDRDALRAQVRVLVDLLDAICKSNPRTQLQAELFEQAHAALAAVREPAPIDHDMLGNPIYETRPPENDIYKQCPWKPVKQEGVPISALAAVREPADHIEHDLEMVPAPACWQPIESAPRQTELLVGRYVHHRCRKSAD